jgi:hypothetical protein
MSPEFYEKIEARFRESMRYARMHMGAEAPCQTCDGAEGECICDTCDCEGCWCHVPPPTGEKP